MQDNRLLGKYYRPLELDFDRFTYQFLLSTESEYIPDDWDRWRKGRWRLGTSGLPVLDIENSAGEDIGWCLGYPIQFNKPFSSKIVIDCQDGGCIDMAVVEKFYNDTAGRYVLVFLTKTEEKLFLDPCGFLPAVYSTSESTVASTPTLFGDRHGWDEELIRSLKMPESDLWFPSGLTPKKGIRRLLPNHYLNLNAWHVGRHWPCAESDFSLVQDPEESLSVIASGLKKTIGAVAEHHPLQLSLTAGRDTRMVLACAREFLSDAHLITFSRDDDSDLHIASKLADMIGLQHSFYPFRTASEDEMLHWQYLTGHAVGGAIWKIHKTFENYDPQRVMLNGVAGETGRAIGWKKCDFNELANTKISANEILEKYRLPCAAKIVRETNKWLSGLTDYNRLNILDLFYIEQKKGCWSGPMFYANIFSKFEISPFNNRSIIQSMVKLPRDYRYRIQLPRDICLREWPELMDIPFNKFTGIHRYKNIKRALATQNRKTYYFAKRSVSKLARIIK